MNTHFIVQTAQTRTGSRFGNYRRIAVLEVVKPLDRVSMISERARGVARIVETWERLNVGTTAACAYERALVEARALAAELNGTTPTTQTPTACKNRLFPVTT